LRVAGYALSVLLLVRPRVEDVVVDFGEGKLRVDRGKRDGGVEAIRLVEDPVAVLVADVVCDGRGRSRSAVSMVSMACIRRRK
jgi:hypothetical protein